MDRKILRTLQANPDMSISDIGDAVGLSQTPCWRRVKRLESDGVIVRRAVILDPKKLGLSVMAFANLKLNNHQEETLEALESEVRRHLEILDCFSMSGDSDYVLRVVVPTIDDYEHFLKRVVVHLPGVASVNSSFVLKSVKATTNLPI
jgi:Lrp/AsnC family transcriptional regulator